METVMPRIESPVGPTPPPGTPAVHASELSVRAVYVLSEAGRKASLLAGGDGRAHQQRIVHVPTTRLHLVTVDVQGVARLKLRPRYQLTDDQRIVRHDTTPIYDAPPTIDDLFRDAARNHELERAYITEHSTTRARRRDDDHEWRSQLARDFMADPGQRAIVHPPPTPKRCVLGTARGRVTFDQRTERGPARDLPAEAHRRFREDLRARKERNLLARTEQLARHEQKKRAIAEWTAVHGSADQQARHAAGVLPMEEIVAAMTDEAFAIVGDVPLYTRDGADGLQARLRQSLASADLVVLPGDVAIVRTDAVKATSAQWAVVQKLQSALPDATVTLREHRLSWRRDPRAPGLTVYGVMVTRQVGPFTLRREFAAPAR